MPKLGFVYILASRRNGTLYVGVTSDPVRRMNQHRSGEIPGFTSKYRVHRLVLIESYESMYEAICREKRLKKWNRARKIRLIEESNPKWTDLYDDLLKGMLGM